MISASKKVAVCNATDSGVKAIRPLLHELHPLAEAVKRLQDKVIKGRAPAAPRAKRRMRPEAAGRIIG